MFINDLANKMELHPILTHFFKLPHLYYEHLIAIYTLFTLDDRRTQHNIMKCTDKLIKLCVMSIKQFNINC